MPESEVRILDNRGHLHELDDTALWSHLEPWSLERRDRTSVFLRVRAALLGTASEPVTIATLDKVIGATVEELNGEEAEPAVVSGVGEPGTWFSWEEFERSSIAASLGIDNTLSYSARANIRVLVAEILDPLREQLGEALVISSGFRSPELNAALGGATHSQHMEGQAADIKTPSVLSGEHDAEWLAAQVALLGLPLDQLIWYSRSKGGHVHVSHDPELVVQREEVLYRDASGYFDRSLPA